MAKSGTPNYRDRDEDRKPLTTPPSGGATTTPGALRPDASGKPAIPSSDAVKTGFFGRTFESLGNRHFRMLWFGTLFGMGGMQMQMIARTILADELTQSAFLTSIVGLGFAPSMLLLSLFGGVAGDKMEKRTLIQVSQIASAVLAAVIGVLILTDAIIWQHLLVASVLQGATFAFQMPARQAIIPKLVGPDKVTNAIAMSAGGMSMMAIAAPAFAGFVYGVGPEYVYFIIAGMFGLAVLATGRIPKVPPEVSEPGKKVLSEVAAGFRYVRGNRIVLLLITSSLVVAVLAMPFRLQFPVFARRLYGDLNVETGNFDLSEPLIGLLLAFAGVGGIVGTLVVANLRGGSHRGLIVLAGSMVSGLAILLLASMPVIWVGMGFMVVVGIAESIRMTLGQSLSIESTAPQYRARVASIYMMTFGLMPLGALPLGYAVDRYGVEKSLMVVGALVIAAGLAFLLGARTLRRLG
ncbi:MAG: MFS transporter [Chloroflexi bacterium]|nr:MFS transporter [Chloroflexota bacterium]